MTPSSLVRQLSDLSTSLLQAEAVLDAQIYKMEPDRRGGAVLVTWAGPPPQTLLEFPQERFGTPEEYLYFIRAREYSFVLNDGAIVQISYRLRAGEICWHRLCYSPCPVHLSASEIDGVTVEEFFEMLSDSDFRLRMQSQTAIRFYYDPQHAKASHPASHVTLNKSCCRIPVKAPVDLRSFVRFVFSNFYPDIWESEACVHAIAPSSSSSCIQIEEMAGLHLHWTT